MPKCLRCSTTITRKLTGRRRRYCSNRCRWATFRKRAKRSVHFRSDTDEWATPMETFAELDREFGPFDLDVCADATNAKCARYFDREQDGLAQTWEGIV